MSLLQLLQSMQHVWPICECSVLATLTQASRMSHGDVAFARRYKFLFDPFRYEAGFFGIIILFRSLLLTFTPALIQDNAGGQSCLLGFVVVGYAACVSYIKPRRLPAANVLEVLTCCCFTFCVQVATIATPMTDAGVQLAFNFSWCAAGLLGLLVIGSGEHVWHPFLAAEQIAQAGYTTRFLATTRSPVVRGPVVRHQITFPDHYGIGLTMYLNNVQPEAWDEILLFTETNLDGIPNTLRTALGKGWIIAADGITPMTGETS